MKDKVQEEILRYQMIRQGDRVVAPPSGGADSIGNISFFTQVSAVISWIKST